MLINRILRKILKQMLSRKSYAKYIGVRFGDNCRFYTDEFGSEPYLITIGDDVTISNNVQFINHDGGIWVVRNIYKEYKNIDIIKQIKIGNNVFIGANVTIMPGVTIGDNVIVGAGSIVTKDLDSDFVYIGIPAKKHIKVEEYIEKNKNNFLDIRNLSYSQKTNYLTKMYNINEYK